MTAPTIQRDWIIPHFHRMSATMAQISIEAARAFGVAVADIYSPNRLHPVAHARQAAMWIAKEKTGKSQSAIGRHFGRDQTTVIHAIHAVNKRLADDPEFEIGMRLLTARIAGGVA